MKVEELLDRAMAASSGGRREEARDLLLDVLALDPGYLEAWLRLGELAASPERAALYYQRAAAIDARSLRAQKGLAQAQGRLQPAPDRERQVVSPALSEERKAAPPRLHPAGGTALPPGAPIFEDRQLVPFTLELGQGLSLGKDRPAPGQKVEAGAAGDSGEGGQPPPGSG